MVPQHRPDRKNPWRVQWRDPLSGKVKSQTFKLKRDADEFEATLTVNRQRQAGGLAKKGTDILFFDYAQNFIKKRMREYPASTWKQDARNLKNYWLEKFGTRVMASITRLEIKEYLDEIQFEKGKSVATRNRHRALIHTMYEWAIDDEKVAENPVSRIPLEDESKHRTRKSGNWKTIEEIDRYIDAMKAQGPMYGMGALILCYAGPRIGEVLALKFGDVEESDNRIVIQRTWERETRKVYERTKGQKSGGHYEVPLFPRVRDAIAAHRAQAKFRKNSDFILQQADGSNLVYEAFHDAHERALKAAELDRITLHGLRHTFATVGGKHGLSKEQIQKVLGHSSIKVTEVYFKTDLSDVIEKAKKTGFGESQPVKLVKIEGGSA